MRTGDRRARFLILTLMAAAILQTSLRAGEDNWDFVALCYHDIVVEANDLGLADAMPITVTKLAEHFDWLRENGYTVISVDQVLAARNRTAPLPDKAVLLSFDDGYTSFYRFVFPLLKAYNYPAMLALQTGWLETPHGEPVDYGIDQQVPRSYFLDWDQIKEMADSGLVELGSHSHALHTGHVSTPQGIRQPAAASRAYDADTGTYESAEELYTRVRDDVSRSADIIEQRTGHRPRIMVWPYGRYNQMSVKAALNAGYQATASLGLFDDGPSFGRYLIHARAVLHDVMVEVNRGLEAGNSRFTGPNRGHFVDLVLPEYAVQRVMHVDLDMVYDPDPDQQQRNLSSLFDRIDAMDVNAVYLQAYADPDGNGTADSLYFPNRHLPMRADLFNYVAWQIQTRLDARVYAWMPVLGFEIAGRPLVQAVRPGTEGSSYDRLSPFDGENRRIIREIFEDLGTHAIISGVLYHDDAILGDYEDTSPAALDWLEEIGLEPDLERIRNDPDAMQYFSRMKTKYLIDFTCELTAAVEAWSPKLGTARNMYAQVLLNPESESWYAQNYNDFLKHYDYVGLMAMPYMEGVTGNPDPWLARLAELVKQRPLGRQKTVFELQAVDWRQDQRGPIPSTTLARQMRLLQANGIGNLGYYPENPITNHPDVPTIYPAFSLVENIYERKPYTPTKP